MLATLMVTIPGRRACTLTNAMPARFVDALALIPAPRTRTRTPARARGPDLTTMRSVVRMPTPIERLPTVTESHLGAAGGANGATTRVVTDEVLLAGFGSPSEPTTRATFTTVPGVAGRAIRLTVADEPTSRRPSRHVTLSAVAEHEPWLAFVDRRVTP